MTYLEIVKDVLEKSETGSSDDIDTVSGLEGFLGQVADDVREAWIQLQQSKQWRFARLSFECMLLEGKREYRPSEMRDSAGRPSIPTYESSNRAASTVGRWYTTSLDGESAWSISDLGSDTATATYGGDIAVVDFSSFRRRYLTRPIGTIPEARPSVLAFQDGPQSIIFNPPPDVSDRYVVYGECQRSAQQLRQDDDVPFGLPEEFHDMIKWAAVMLVQQNDQENEGYQYAQSQFTRYLTDAVQLYVPEITLGPALA